MNSIRRSGHRWQHELTVFIAAKLLLMKLSGINITGLQTLPA